MKILLARVLIGLPLMMVLACHTWAESPESDDQVVSLVEERIGQWWLKPEERRFDQIGWANDIRTAKQLSAQHQRPVFLFTMDGRVNTGRC